MFNYDENDDFSLYEPTDFVKYYHALIDLAEKKKGLSSSEATLQLLNMYIDIDEEVKKIGKSIGVSSDDFDAIVIGGYADDLVKKRLMLNKLKELKRHIMMSIDDNSWTKRPRRFGPAIIGFAYLTQRWMNIV